MRWVDSQSTEHLEKVEDGQWRSLLVLLFRDREDSREYVGVEPIRSKGCRIFRSNNEQHDIGRLNWSSGWEDFHGRGEAWFPWLDFSVEQQDDRRDEHWSIEVEELVAWQVSILNRTNDRVRERREMSEVRLLGWLWFSDGAGYQPIRVGLRVIVFIPKTIGGSEWRWTWATSGMSRRKFT